MDSLEITDTEIITKVCRQPNTLGLVFGFTNYLPLVVIFIMNGASIVYGSDIGLFLVYNASAIINFFAAWGLSEVIREQRPEFYRECGYTSYATPDMVFFPVLTFNLFLGATGFMGETRMTRSRGILIFSVSLLYILGVWYNEYFTLSQTLINTAMAFVSAAFWIIVYYFYINPNDKFIAAFRVFRWLGLGSFFSKINKI